MGPKKGRKRSAGDRRATFPSKKTTTKKVLFWLQRPNKEKMKTIL